MKSEQVLFSQLDVSRASLRAARSRVIASLAEIERKRQRGAKKWHGTRLAAREDSMGLHWQKANRSDGRGRRLCVVVAADSKSESDNEERSEFDGRNSIALAAVAIGLVRALACHSGQARPERANPAKIV